MVSKMHRVLFVDDDPLVLRGLSRSADEFSENWQVDFASSGRDAITLLSQHAYDALVTDMHMPGMDGLQLLQIVSRDLPGVMRFVLSGNTSSSQALAAAHLVHQMIPKPCEMETIYAIVERACRLRDMLSDPHLLQFITGIKTLPSVPLIYNNLVKELQSEDTSPQVVGGIIAKDAAMTAKILQLVNSAFFALPENVSSPQRAVTILGLNTVKALVLGIQVFSEFHNAPGLPISVDAVWKHSILVSSLAYTIAKELNLKPQEREDVRVSGMLHDVGILLYLKIPIIGRYVRFNKPGLISNESEYEAIGTSHAEMGGYLLGMWGLPTSIVEAVTFHHQPWMQVSPGLGTGSVLYIANALLNMSRYEKSANFLGFLDLDYIRSLGLTGYLDAWLRLAKNLTLVSSQP